MLNLKPALTTECLGSNPDFSWVVFCVRPLQKTPFCPISTSYSNFNPRNTQCIPVVKIFPFLELEQKSTTTPKKGGLNGDPERVFDKTILTAEPQRSQSFWFFFFAFR